MKNDDQTEKSGLSRTDMLSDPLLASLESYWQTLRHARSIPARSDLQPNQIDAVLPHAFIVQRVAPGVARFRVAGQRLHDILKMDARGMPLSTFFLPEARETLAQLVEAAFQEPAILGLPLVSEGTFLRPAVHGAMLMLPMQDDQGRNNRLLGAFVSTAPAQARPLRFDIDPAASIRHETLGLSVVATTLHPKAATRRKEPDTLRHPALRLVVNNG
ncbi:MAG: PAS domain-containing protein [Yoonia sp.]|uniref:PAS domain-containing protein n=1 Tax=Yoonia sp. TaxID=2212373 RepID=UPI003EF648E4